MKQGQVARPRKDTARTGARKDNNRDYKNYEKKKL